MKIISSKFVVVLFAAMLSLPMTFAFAADWDGGESFDLGGWSGGSYGDDWSGGSYSDWSGGSYGDDWSGGSYGYDWSGNSYGDDWSGGSYGYDWSGGSYGDDWSGGSYGDDWSGGSFDEYPGYDEYTENPGYDQYNEFPGYDEYGENPGYDDGVYYDGECGCYAYGDEYDYEVTDTYGSYGSSGYSSGKGFSIPSFTSSGFSYAKPMSFSSPSYPTYTPTYTPPAKTTGGNSSVSNVTNTTITNVDNSINDSFNNYNSGNTIISTAPLTYATPQYPIVYTHPAPYCQIYQASSASGYGVNSVYLSWTSSNASSAYLSNVGSVNVNGSTTVWPTYGMTYTLTVYGLNGQSAQCQVAVNAYSAPYVSLTQIPYTGFDFGTIGNAMYWAGLAIFALGAGYLAVYYLPRTVLGKAGIPAVAFAGVRTRKQFAPIVAPKAPIMVEKEVEAKLSPIVNAIRKAGTLDSMAIVDRKDGSMPKIVISRD